MATYYPCLVTQLDRFLSWADTNRNCNTFLRAVTQYYSISSGKPILPSNQIDNQMSMDSEIHSFMLICLTNCCIACQSINQCNKPLFRSLENLAYIILIWKHNLLMCPTKCVFIKAWTILRQPIIQQEMDLIFDLCPAGYCLFQSIKQKQNGPFDLTQHDIWETITYWDEKLWPNLRPKTSDLFTNCLSLKYVFKAYCSMWLLYIITKSKVSKGQNLPKTRFSWKTGGWLS